MAETIRGARVLLRPVEPDDLPWLHATAADPAVAAWWDVGTGTDWVDELLDDQDLVAYIAEAGGAPVGYVQWQEEDDPAYRHASLDVFVAGWAQGKGYGREIVHTAARWLIQERGHHRLEIDPAAANERAIRSYQAIGFRTIGLARRRERSQDGTWRDSLLMDLLAEDLASRA